MLGVLSKIIRPCHCSEKGEQSILTERKTWSLFNYKKRQNVLGGVFKIIIKKKIVKSKSVFFSLSLSLHIYLFSNEQNCQHVVIHKVCLQTRVFS